MGVMLISRLFWMFFLSGKGQFYHFDPKGSVVVIDFPSNVKNWKDRFVRMKQSSGI